jgi:GWxTD domain-containing protein
VELYNRENKLITNTSRKFFVSNTRVALTEVGEQELFDAQFSLSEQEVDYYLKAMRYVSNSSEVSMAEACRTFDEKKRYFYAFWDKRRANPNDSPFKPFSQFRARVNYANDHYKSAFTEGWRTDRGRIMIMHGPPANIDYHPSDNLKFPHEIWTYNKIETQSAVVFVFYEPMESNNEYNLLHSNLFGENNNPRWKLDLVRRGMQDNNLDNNGDRLR